jgi:(1->4)-alpha-D-glucan 1-alpha-D-glucosylmutase
MLDLTATNREARTGGAKVNRIPLATYRLQLQAGLDLEQLDELLPYLERLGISDIYLSPLFRARHESSHGYDVVDHGTIDPSIGNLASFQRVAEAARDAGMGILLDVVPNHMGINDPGNAWWLDVLENGPGAYFATFFDIDWRPAASALHDTVLLPFLGDAFGRVLENGELKVMYEDNRLQLCHGTRRFPLAPPTWTEVLELAHKIGAPGVADADGDPRTVTDWIEFESIIAQLKHLPPARDRSAAAMEERYREQSVARRRLADLLQASLPVKESLDQAIRQVNGDPANPRSFDTLERLLDQQWYRLAYWRVAADEINYRRFFDINELAAIRVEEPRVFDAVHRLVGRFLTHGWITGLRIDHPDGLRDPLNYFQSLQSLYRAQQPAVAGDSRNIFIVAEKILSENEQLPSDWAVCGTTGYDLMNVLSRVLVAADGLAEIRRYYDEAGLAQARSADVVYESKRAILLHSMASELQMLSAQLYRIAQQHRASRDFTRPALQRALREIIACMAVYRTYVRSDSWDVSEADYRIVTTAVRMAKRRNRTSPASVFDFISSVMLLENPPTLTGEQAAERRQFAVKLQQVTGPVAAKGVEDTAFYRYFPLASLNEVGGDLAAKPLSTDEFHRLMRQRCAEWPHSQTATATHDSKRGEDLRARLHVLTEVPQEWIQAFERWIQMNRRFAQESDGELVPDLNEQYLLYQTLVGTWPYPEGNRQMSAEEPGTYTDRIVQYMLKALREAKLHTSWMNPEEGYEAAVIAFVQQLLSDETGEFQADLAAFAHRIAGSGLVNSLAQLLLKVTVPGVPDFYQGTELWDFNLVDPDNRRPVDFAQRRRRLDNLLAKANKDIEVVARGLSSSWPDPDVKLWVTSRCLSLRRDWPEVFCCGEYVPLAAVGPAAEHVLSFARHFERKCVVTVVPRQFHTLGGGHGEKQRGVPRANWQGTRLILPVETNRPWRNPLTGRLHEPQRVNRQVSLEIEQLFDTFPVALLTLHHPSPGPGEGPGEG